MSKKIIVYGKGNLGKLAEEILTRLKIKYEVRDKEDIDQYNTVKNRSKVKVLVCVAITSYTEIETQLEEKGFSDVQHFYYFLLDYPEVGINNGWRCSRSMYKQIPIKFRGIDKKHWNWFVKWRMFGYDDGMVPTNNRYVIPEIVELGFKPDIITLNTLKHFKGSSLTEIIERRSRDAHVLFYDKKKGDYRIIHAEGVELQLLWYKMPSFVQERPVLAVTVYHSIDGMYNIPALLHRELKNYQFHFRLHAFAGQNAVLYAIPKERIKSGK